MRWNLLVLALTLALPLVGGCKKQCFLTESDFNRTTTTLLDGIEQKPDLAFSPLAPRIDAPPTLSNLDRKIRYISLAECVATALEQGTVGLAGGQVNDNLVGFNPGTGGFSGSFQNNSDAIRVLALNPARTGQNIEFALSRFDAVFAGSMQWQTTDQPIGTPLQTFQAANQTSISQTDATFETRLIKPLATGGAAAVVFNVPYQFTNLPARVNPSYRPSLQFQFEQPLLQGFGVEINQLTPSHPGSILNGQFLNTNPNSGRSGDEGILITRTRFDQSRAGFESSVNQMLLNVEQAYWNLYASYWALYSREQGLRFAFEAFKLNKARYEAGRTTAADYYQSRGQYEQFRSQRITAIRETLRRERLLRSLLGLANEDGCRLMPCDSPTLAPYLPDWGTARDEALARRPELFIARQQVKVSQLILTRAKNLLLPDLRFATTYDVNSIGNRLDGPADNPTETNALRGLSDANFSNWTAQLRLTVPIGFRLAHAQVRAAQLDLAQSMETLKDNERKAQAALTQAYQDVNATYESIRATRATREAFGEQLRARQQEFLAGRGTLDTLLEAQRFWADALSQEFQNIADYNNSLAGFEFAKGTIMQHDNVTISEGPLPMCAAVRAVDHERQRTASLVLFERAVPNAPKSTQPDPLIPGKAPSLPSAMAAVPPLKDAPMSSPTVGIPPLVEARIDEVFPDAPAPLSRQNAPAAQSNPVPVALPPVDGRPR